MFLCTCQVLLINCFYTIEIRISVPMFVVNGVMDFGATGMCYMCTHLGLSRYFRCAVVGCYITEDYLLEKEGVFLLIDLLQVRVDKII